MVVARLSNSKLILIVSLKAYIQGPTKAHFKVNSVLFFQPCRQALPDRLCPTNPPVKQKPDRKHQPAPTSRGAVCSSARKHSPWKFRPRT
ncbi:hypothetical protein ACFX13_002699 [Malus domestica]